MPAVVRVREARRVGNLGNSLMSKLLPLLAPIVMAYLANKLVGLGDLLGGLLGGGRK